MSQLVFLNQEIPLVSSWTSNLLIVIDHTMSTAIEAQSLSQVDIEKGVNVTFPMKGGNISAQSEVPSATISEKLFNL